MLSQIIFQVSSAALLALLMSFLGRISKRLGYVNFSEITAEGFLGYNILFRFLSPSVFISLLTILLYFLRLEELIRNIWLIAVWYAVITFGITLSLNRLPLINKPLYFAVQLSAIGLAYVFYAVALSRGLGFIVPDNANFRTELWLIILIFFYSLLNSYGPDTTGHYTRKKKFILNRFKSLMEHYGKLIEEVALGEEFLKSIIYGVMIVEDLNRNRIVRTFEKYFFPLGFVRTTGIMQVRSDRCLSDEESIKIGAEKLKNAYKQFKDTSESNYDLLKSILSDYNEDREYIEAVLNVYTEIYDSAELYARRQQTPVVAGESQRSNGFSRLEDIKDFDQLLNFVEKGADEIKRLVQDEKRRRQTKI